MTWIIEHWDLILAFWGALVTLASVVVKLTPTPRDDAWLAAFLRFVGHVSIAKPKEPGSVPPKPPRSRPPATPTTLAMLLALALAGCGGTALRAQYVSLGTVGDAVQNLGEEVEDTCDEEALTSREGEEREDFRVACIRANEGQNAVVETWLSWREVARKEGFEAADALGYTVRLVALYDEVAAFLRAFGKDVPPLPIGGE